MKRFLATLLTLSMAVACFSFVACGKKDKVTYDLKVGAIMVGDREEGYTKAHMDGIDAAVATLKAEGKNIKVTYALRVGEDATCQSKARQFAAAKNDIVITNSYGHQFQLIDVVDAFPNTTFISMTGDLAAYKQKSNWKNAFTNVYESRYVSGVVAGLKLQELVNTPGALSAENYDAQGRVKVGYIGAYNYAEVVSGYTAFYLGIKSQFTNFVMNVEYTGSWFDIEKEAEKANAFVNAGCVIIGQHADSTGAPGKCEELKNAGKVCYSVGYNVDMLDAAPTAALTSATNNWEVYYEYAFRAAIAGEEIAQDWAKGYNDNAVAITALGPNCAAGTQAIVNTVVDELKAGTRKVFDVSTFTVNGDSIDTYGAGFWNDFDKVFVSIGEAIVTDPVTGITYFEESVLHSAPYFDIRIDGINEGSMPE